MVQSSWFFGKINKGRQIFTRFIKRKEKKKESLIKIRNRDFPSGPVVETFPSCAEGTDSMLGHGTKIPYALWPKKNIKTEAIL